MLYLFFVTDPLGTSVGHFINNINLRTFFKKNEICHSFI